jgi:glucose-6-phosphate isomerase
VSNFNFEIKPFAVRKTNQIVSKNLKKLLNKNNEIINSLTSKYVNNFKIKRISKLIGKRNIKLIGMGGSILGSKAIYDYLKKKIKRKFLFFDNLTEHNINNLISKNYTANIIVSKSGNTLETIVNTHNLIGKKDKNIFITEKKNNYLRKLAENLRAEVIDHNNYIGGRYSVLSEVGMLPAELMGLNSKNFKQLNNLINNKKFLKNLIFSVEKILFFVKKKKYNSVIINYDYSLNSFFEWYQQLVAESLGKKNSGILPIISNMPKDNHSLMQLYLDGFKNNFYSIFFSKEDVEKKNTNNYLYPYSYLKNYDINDILLFKMKATQRVFNKKKIPYRSFTLQKRNEKTIGELFCFFILETILLGKCMNVNPYSQPSVELIKKETKKYFNRSSQK